jgi:acetyl-CoA C-acetyltransferase
MESMSNVPFYTENMRWGNKYGNVSLIDGLVKDGLTDVYDGKAMGVAAEMCASTCGISREDQDAFAIESYKRSQAASQNGKFDNEIIPVSIPQKKGEYKSFSIDEHPRLSTVDVLAGLKPAFKEDGTVTAGNSSGINDGAACCILASESMVKKFNLKPMARIVSVGAAGVDPAIMGIGPVPATEKALKKAGLSVKDIDVFELNEAFAAQVLASADLLNVDMSRVNLNGGSIAIGHPLGASGTRISATLLHHMAKHPSKKYGLATAFECAPNCRSSSMADQQQRSS